MRDDLGHAREYTVLYGGKWWTNLASLWISSLHTHTHKHTHPLKCFFQKDLMGSVFSVLGCWASAFLTSACYSWVNSGFSHLGEQQRFKARLPDCQHRSFLHQKCRQGGEDKYPWGYDEHLEDASTRRSPHSSLFSPVPLQFIPFFFSIPPHHFYSPKPAEDRPWGRVGIRQVLQLCLTVVPAPTRQDKAFSQVRISQGLWHLAVTSTACSSATLPLAAFWYKQTDNLDTFQPN